ncbi:hypothetical protein [Vibrio fluvialis]|uniref:hypothetical protein n=1 Tax=Vibrio fluvialis TaxID=676 RepID=UPI0023A9B815|nr:hypothetical protein [Vibrio fluvialis]MDE5179008.1 hypothetical protein [Vibrio fluvialis]
MTDTTKDLSPVGGDENDNDLDVGVPSLPKEHLAPAVRSVGDSTIPTIPDTVAGDDASSEGKKKRNPVVNGIVHVVRSVGNSVYDVALRPANPRTPNNAVYIDNFLKSTFRDFKRLGEVPDTVRQHEWIDSKRLPFLQVVLQLPDMNMDIIRSRCNILFTCLLCSAMVTMFALYKTFYSIGIVVLMNGFTAAQILSVVYWFVFFLFTGFCYFYYNYHTWIIASDRFGTPSHFVVELKEAERTALFPFYDYYLNYLRREQ